MKEIRKIIAEYDAVDFQVEKVALASVVNVEESSYRRIGARMLVRSSGLWIGGISGGCLEGDALKRSQKAIFKNRPSRVVYDTMDDDKNQIGVGLGCNGRIEVLFTPVDPNDPNNPIENLRKIVERNKPTILLKVIDAPKDDMRLGQAKLLDQDVIESDFVNLDAEKLSAISSEVWQNRKTSIHTLSTSTDDDLKLLVEYVRPETRLFIVGDNYDVNAFIGIAHELGWETTIIGRAKKLSKSAFALTKRVVEYEEAGELEVDEFSAVVLMSHDYNWDMKMLPIFLNKGAKYIGMLGPKKRMEKMQKEMPDIDLVTNLNFYSPVGLDIGAESPEEIALSIAAEIIAIFKGRSGASLKLREGTIHERT